MSIVPLEEAAEESEFGGKSASLARALREGLPVPPGFALSWTAVERIVSGDGHRTDQALERLRAMGTRVSVRSSAIGEDSGATSFAGQHLTLLHVGPDDFADAVRRVWVSGDTPASREYRARLGVAGPARVAVTVQAMVDAEKAGVLFTRNPATSADEILIEASWGLGESVVAGSVTPDRYRIDSSGAIVEKTAGEKDIELRLAGSGGTEERAVSAERIRALCLDDQELDALRDLALRCQKTFGEAIDIEFAFARGRLYLLQCRPITAIPAATPQPHPDSMIPASAGPEPEPLRARQLVGFGLAAILAPLNSTMIAVALPAIGQSFGASGATLTLCLVSVYLLVSILAQSPSGKLADVFGYSRILSAGRLIFAAGALAGAVAPSVAVLTIARVAMAIGSAMNIPPVMAELRNRIPPERRGRLFGIFGATMGVAAAIGPLLGDLLIVRFGWHSVFLVNLPIILFSFLLEPPRKAAATRAEPRRFRLDLGGSLLFTVSVSLLVGGVLWKNPAGWAAVAAGAGIFFLFIRKERRTADPLLDPALFAAPAFAAGSGIVALQNFALYAVLFLVPFLIQGGGYGAMRPGTFLLAMTAAMVVASPAGGRLGDAAGAKVAGIAGGLVAASGAVALIFAASGGSNWMLLSLATLGAGIGFATSPSQAAALTSISREKAGSAAGALSTMRYIGGVLGSGAVGLIITADAPQPLLWIFPIALLASAALATFLPDRVNN